MLLDAAVQERAGDLHLGGQFGEQEPVVLELADRPPERGTVAAVLHRRVERELRGGDGTHGDGHALADQVLDEVDEALALLAEQVGRRHPGIGEEQLGGVLRLEADLVEVAAALETGQCRVRRRSATARPAPWAGSVLTATMTRSARMPLLIKVFCPLST